LDLCHLSADDGRSGGEEKEEEEEEEEEDRNWRMRTRRRGAIF
jgi:hypothetical protein